RSWCRCALRSSTSARPCCCAHAAGLNSWAAAALSTTKNFCEGFMGLKAVLFDLDDTLYTSFQAGDAYAYERLAAWAEGELGVSGTAFADAFRQSRAHLSRQQPGMPPIHDRVVSAQRALERMGLNAI